MLSGKQTQLIVAILLFSILGAFFYFTPKLTSFGLSADGGIGADFKVSDARLMDTSNKHRSLAEFSKENLLIYFGYPNCPKVCPLAIKELNKVVNHKGHSIKVIFINIDTSEESQKALQSFLSNFSSKIIGLNSGQDSTLKVATNFKNSIRRGFEGHLNITYYLDKGLVVKKIYNKFNAEKFIKVNLKK